MAPQLRCQSVAPSAVSLILIADDNPHAQRMGRQILHQEGHEVETVSNGDEALTYLSERKPSLVMLDTRMPGPSGYDVCELIKNSDDLAGIKVVLLAGPLEPFDPAQASRVGSDAVLHKPLDAYSLIETVHSLIGKAAPASLDEAPGVAEAPVPEPKSTPTPGEPAAVEEIPSELEASVETPEGAPENPELAAVSAQAANPLDELVKWALDDPEKKPALDADVVRASVVEVLEASIPALAETITKRILARHQASKAASN